MAKTVPPKKSELEAVRRFEKKIEGEGEASARLDNIASAARRESEVLTHFLAVLREHEASR